MDPRVDELRKRVLKLRAEACIRNGIDVESAGVTGSVLV